MAKQWCFGTTRSPTVFQGVSRHVSRPKCPVSRLQVVPISIEEDWRRTEVLRRKGALLPPIGWPPMVPGGQPGTRRPAWILRAESIFSSKVDFHFRLSYFSSEKNPRACSGFEDLILTLAIGFEHQEGDSDLHWSLLARYLWVTDSPWLTTSVVTLYLTLSQIYFYRLLWFPPCLCVLISISLWVAKYLVGDNMWILS